jgi:hypothetical protein
MSRKNPGPTRAKRLRSDEPFMPIVIELIYVAGRVFDETFGSGRETAEKIAERVEMTLEKRAAALFVRDGEMALRRLLPDVPRDEIEDYLSQQLGAVYGDPRRERYDQDAAREGITLEQLLAVVMIVTLHAQFGAFGPEMPGLRSPDQSDGSHRSR